MKEMFLVMAGCVVAFLAVVACIYWLVPATALAEARPGDRLDRSTVILQDLRTHKCFTLEAGANFVNMRAVVCPGKE